MELGGVHHKFFFGEYVTAGFSVS